MTHKWRSGERFALLNSSDLLASLPMALFGVGITATSLIRGGPWYAVPSWRIVLSLAVGVIPMGVIALGGLAALVRGMPDWGWSWVGAAFIGAALFFQMLVSELKEAGTQLPNWAGTSLFLFSFAAGVILLVAAALRDWRCAGEFSMSAAGAFGLSMFLAIIAGPFYRHDLAPLAAPLGLVYASMIYAFRRSPNPYLPGVVAAAGGLNVASFILANHVWRQWLAENSRSSPLVPLIVLGTGLLLSGPLLGWLARPLRSSLDRPL